MNKKIKELARKLTRGKKNIKEKAESLWDFAKEEIKYKLTIIGDPENILKAGYGSCIDKTILFIALAKSLGIKARYHVILIDLNSALGKITKKESGLAKKIGLNSPLIKLITVFKKIPLLPHTYPEVFVEGKWLKIKKPSLDKELENHFKGGLLPDKIYQKDFGTFNKISEILEKPEMQTLIKVAKKQNKISSSVINIINEFFYSLRKKDKEVLREDENIKEIIERIIEFSKKEKGEEKN